MGAVSPIAHSANGAHNDIEVILDFSPPGMMFPAKPMVSTLSQTPLMLALTQGRSLPAASW